MKGGPQCFKVRTALGTWCTDDGKAKLEKQAAAEEPTGEGETKCIWSKPKQLELLNATTAERKRRKDVVYREDNKRAPVREDNNYRPVERVFLARLGRLT